jgi:hypothetical protein
MKSYIPKHLLTLEQFKNKEDLLKLEQVKINEDFRDEVINPHFVLELDEAGFESWKDGETVNYIKNKDEDFELVIKAIAKDKLVAFVKAKDGAITDKKEFSTPAEAIKYLNGIKVTK